MAPLRSPARNIWPAWATCGGGGLATVLDVPAAVLGFLGALTTGAPDETEARLVSSVREAISDRRNRDIGINPTPPSHRMTLMLRAQRLLPLAAVSVICVVAVLAYAAEPAGPGAPPRQLGPGRRRNEP